MTLSGTPPIPLFIAPDPPQVSDEKKVDSVIVHFIEHQLLGVINALQSSKNDTAVYVLSYSPYLMNQVLGVCAQQVGRFRKAYGILALLVSRILLVVAEFKRCASTMRPVKGIELDSQQYEDPEPLSGLVSRLCAPRVTSKAADIVTKGRHTITRH